MIRILQNISGRERLLLGSFLAVMLLIWASSLLGRWERSGEILREARTTVGKQEVWLENAPLLEAKLEETLADLDASRMLDGADLAALVDSYARANDLNHELGEPATEEGKLFSRTTVRATFRNVPLEKLLRLHLHLAERRPYVAVETLGLVANRADPRLLNARFDLSAIEVHPNDPPEPR